MAAKKDKSRRLSSRDLLGARDKADKSAKAIRGSSALQRLSHTSLSVNYTDKYLEYCRTTTRLEPQYKFMRTKLYQNLLDYLEVKEMNQLTPQPEPILHGGKARNNSPSREVPGQCKLAASQRFKIYHKLGNGKYGKMTLLVKDLKTSKDIALKMCPREHLVKNNKVRIF